MVCNSNKRNDSVMRAPDCDEVVVRVGQTFLSADVRPDCEDAAGKPGLRAYGPVKASAARQAEKTGDSSLRSE